MQLPVRPRLGTALSKVTRILADNSEIDPLNLKSLIDLYFDI